MNDQTGRRVTAGIALVVAVATLLPWAKIAFVSINGADTDRGVVVLCVSIAAGILAFWRGYWILQILASLATAGILAWFWYDVTHTPANALGLEATPGAGLWLPPIAPGAWLGFSISRARISWRSHAAQAA